MRFIMFKIRAYKIQYVLFVLIAFTVILQLSIPSRAAILSEDFNALFENHGSMMLIINLDNGSIVDVNKAAVKFYGYSREELLAMTIYEINTLSPEAIADKMSAAESSECNFFSFEHVLKNGEVRNVEVHSYPYQDDQGHHLLHSIIHDVTDKIKAEAEAKQQRIIIWTIIIVSLLIVIAIMIQLLKTQRKLRNISERFQDLFTNMNEGFVLYEMICNEKGVATDYRLLEMNRVFEAIMDIKRKATDQNEMSKVISYMTVNQFEKYAEVALNNKELSYDYYSEVLKRHFTVNVYSPKYKQFAMIFTDITDRIEKESKIEYLSYHDQLTGLYNRRFYEEERRRLDISRNLPFSTVMMDVNGLKLSNDAFGHILGDQLLQCVAEVIKEEFRADDILARVGGDEFVVLLPKTSEAEVAHIVSRVMERMQYERIDVLSVSVSMGWATKTEMIQDIEDVFTKAEEMMYSRKLIESKAMRLKTIDIILDDLRRRSQQQYEHSQNVSQICGEFGRFMNYDDDLVQELERAGALHDIGKISFSESLFDGSRGLSDDEYEEIKRHTEIGYHILKSVDEYATISDCALSHHEWWDGTGYPRNIAGEKIPLLARIISIVNAYEVMTSERPYRETLYCQDALKELKRYSGSQFDPDLLAAFSDMILEKHT
ncbi:MAG: diguanylate cyclase [Clostridia bacterium]|nr:diguanylate cyclase [Clostridia bacterium]